MKKEEIEAIGEIEPIEAIDAIGAIEAIGEIEPIEAIEAIGAIESIEPIDAIEPIDDSGCLQVMEEEESIYGAYKNKKLPGVLLKQTNWENLNFYRKSDVVYQLTVAFCQRFLPKYGDRTVDQMVQAARSGKQNFVEGLSDGVTSTEMQLKLLNVGRASIQELREDFKDYLLGHGLSVWQNGHNRFQGMIDFCKTRNQLEDYSPYFSRWDAETMANTGLTLCHMIDTMLNHFMMAKEVEFVKYGGIKERMHRVRTGYRQGQDEHLRQLEAENQQLKAKIDQLQNEIERLKKR